MPTTGLAAASSAAGRVSASGSSLMVVGEGGRSGGDELLLDPVVALGLELEGEGLVAALHDPAVPHHVDVVGHDVVEQPLVVGDEEDAELRAAHGVDAVG